MRKLWVDTNCARSPRALKGLAEIAARKGIAVWIHPVVYVERRRQMRAAKQQQFSSARFDDFLQTCGIAVIPLDQVVAAGCADMLYTWYSDDSKWQAAKRAVISETRHGDVPMTADWLVAATIAAEPGSYVITKDKGFEWSMLRVKNVVLGWDEALALLSTLPDVPAPPSV